MPILRVTSLPFENQDSSAWPTEVCKHFSASTDIPLKHVSTTWQLLPQGHYAHGGNSAHFQPQDSHPVLIEIMLPDFYAIERVEVVILAVVDAVSYVSHMPKDNIFVQVNRARSGAVYDDGRIVRW